jgi:DNA-binding transcriptional LysR family regulator
MNADLNDIGIFSEVVKAGGFREASRVTGISASTLSGTVKRLETRLNVRLLHRTTRSVTPTEAGLLLLERLNPAFEEINAALKSFEGYQNRTAGTLKLNVPISAARLILPEILPGFMLAYPDIKVEIDTEDMLVDVLSLYNDAGIRHHEKLEQDMIAIPIGPRVMRFVTAASSEYLDKHGRPSHPSEIAHHSCIVHRYVTGALASPWEFERNKEVVKISPNNHLTVRVGGATDLAVTAAIAGVGIIHLFEDWLNPYFIKGSLEPVLQEWCKPFSGMFLYYSGRRLIPPPLRAFIDYVKKLNLSE